MHEKPAQSMVHIYKDSNVFEGIASPDFGDEFLKNWNLSCKKLKIFGPGVTHANIVSGPAVIIELLGLQRLPPVSWSESASSTVREYIENSYEEAKQHFNQQPELSEAHLQKLSIDRKNHHGSQGKFFIELLVDKPLSSLTIKEDVVDFFALEAVCGREHPSKFRDEVHLEISFMIFDMMKAKKNRSLFRIVSKMWERLRTTSSAKKDPKLLKKMNVSLGLKPSGDYIDSELIHYAVIGTFHGEELLPVHCFTTDKTEIISDRIVMYKSLLDFLREVIKDKFNNVSRFTKIQNVPGFVHIVDKKTGRVTKTLNVKLLGDNWKVRIYKLFKKIFLKFQELYSHWIVR